MCSSLGSAQLLSNLYRLLGKGMKARESLLLGLFCVDIQFLDSYGSIGTEKLESAKSLGLSALTGFSLRGLFLLFFQLLVC